jgi:hypothetical protein
VDGDGAGAGNADDEGEAVWGPSSPRTRSRWWLAAWVVAAVAVYLSPFLMIGAIALWHRLTLPPIDPLVAAASRIEDELGADDLALRPREVDGPSGCSIVNPGCPSVTVTALVDAPTLAVATVSDAVSAAGFGDVDGSLRYVRDDNRCCYLAVVDGYEVMVQVTRAYEAPPPAAGEYVEARISHLSPTTRSHLDR